ncbi:MAG: hypothetical protein EBT07_11805 [Actinobacteria bacterium]|nr:hypothetical protein [Actinomycetota bacterium]
MQSFNSSASTTTTNMENHIMNQILKATNSIRAGLAVLAGISILGGTASTQAASIASPASIVEVSFAGGGKRDFVSTPYVRAEEASGTIGAVGSATTLTLVDEAAATYVNGRFTPGTATQDNKYILEVLDGRYIGLIAYIKSNTGNTLTVDEVSLPTDGLLVGSKYAIRKDWTIESLFGPASATSPLGSGSSTASADNVNIYNQKTQAYTTYFIRNSSGVYTWRDAVGNLANHVRIPYGQGVQVLRRAAGNGSLTLSGELRTSRIRRDLLKDKTALVANLSPSPTTLGDLNVSIDRANSASGSVVKVWNPSTQAWTAYYRRTSDGKFFDGLTVRDSIVVGAGKVVQVVNKGSADRVGATALTVDPRLP